ncbi:MAG TPA: PPOX class F420-dependent oxidoreductase [Candidatus Baltobacteraceae bacterium]|nr:PPOX class F420-dependent oxidoreductase [Candidatus Baltobacteraceae bacterium]
MSVFSDLELTYLASQRLGRLATVGRDGAPHVVPVSFSYNGGTDTIDIGGHELAGSKKWRDIRADPRAAFVVDDVLPPWRPRMVEIRGLASLVSAGGATLGPGFADELIRITPTRIVSFGLDGTRDLHARDVGPSGPEDQP